MNRQLRRHNPRTDTMAAFSAAWQEYRMRNEYFDGEREIEAAAYERFRARWCQQNGHLIGSEDVPLHWRGSNPVEERSPHNYYRTENDSDRYVTEKQAASEMQAAQQKGLAVYTTDKGFGFTNEKGTDVHFRCYCAKCYGQEDER